MKRNFLQSAFTLLEILASIFIFAILTLGIASTMKQTTSLTKRVKSREAKTMSSVIALDRLQRELGMAYYGGRVTFPEHVLFKLSEASLGSEIVFSVIDSPIKTLVQRRSPGLLIVQYKLEKEENGTMRLVRLEVPFYDKAKLSEANAQTLATGILQFKLEAYDHRNDRWLKEWDDRGPTTGNYIPKAVRVMLESVDPELPKDQWRSKSFKLQTEIIVLNEWETR